MEKRQYVLTIKKYLNMLLLDAANSKRSVSIEGPSNDVRYGYIPATLLVTSPGDFINDEELREIATDLDMEILSTGQVGIYNNWYFPDTKKVSSAGVMYHPYGHVIALDGVDATGKDTLINAFKETYQLDDSNSFVAEGLGGTSLGDWARNAILSLDKPYGDLSQHTQFHLMIAQREQLLSEKILPALREGKVILANRFGLSTIVYQGYENESIRQQAAQIHTSMIERIGRPAFSQMVLIGQSDVLLKRMDKRGEDDLLQRRAIAHLDDMQNRFNWPYTPRKIIDTTTCSVDDSVEAIYDGLISITYKHNLL